MSGRLGLPTRGGGESPSWPRAKSKVCQGRLGWSGRSRRVRLIVGQASSAHLTEGKSAEAEDEMGSHGW